MQKAPDARASGALAAQAFLTELARPPALAPGAYVACFETEADSALAGLDARSRTVLFVRAPQRRSRIVVNLPLFTYHAYNQAEVDGTAEGEIWRLRHASILPYPHGRLNREPAAPRGPAGRSPRDTPSAGPPTSR